MPARQGENRKPPRRSPTGRVAVNFQNREEMGFSDSIRVKLENALSPERLEIIDESHLHAGHQPGFDGSGETHLRIRIVSPAFENLNRVERHRRINVLIEEEIAEGLHAIAIEAKAPSETA